MEKIGLVYESDTGNTQYAAETIEERIGEGRIDLYDVRNEKIQKMLEYDCLILGIPT